MGSRYKTNSSNHCLGSSAVLPRQRDRTDARHPPRASPGGRLLLVGGRRHVGDADRLLEAHRRRDVQRRGHAGAALAGRPRPRLHAAQRNRLARQRRPGLLGHVGHASRGERLSQSAARPAAVARARPGGLQYAGKPRPARRHLQRRDTMADPLRKQRIRLQE